MAAANSINLIDGIDGIAKGTTMISRRISSCLLIKRQLPGDIHITNSYGCKRKLRFKSSLNAFS